VRISSGHIQFNDVCFHYQTERPILDHIDLDIRPGEKVAIVGPSGAGKSTLSRLLYRFYDVTSGAITIDGIDIRDCTQDSLRKAIAIVPQDTVLFNNTLWFNLHYGNPNASPGEIDEAVQYADLQQFVKQLPDGYQTVVGERGLKLSGGEKQRVGIARAFLKKPRIMIFDEATSSLDSNSEQSILKSMKKVAGGMTTLTIAHRLSTIVDADRIYVINAGRIIESGDHQQLLGLSGLYHKLWCLQQAENAGGVSSFQTNQSMDCKSDLVL
jgi:ATP-binding cassette subfamily B protein